MEDRLYFVTPHDPDNEIVFALSENNNALFDRDKVKGNFVAVSVSDEQAVDSYNSTFTCTFHLSEEQAAQVRDFLNHHFPKE